MAEDQALMSMHEIQRKLENEILNKESEQSRIKKFLEFGEVLYFAVSNGPYNDMVTTTRRIDVSRQIPNFWWKIISNDPYLSPLFPSGELQQLLFFMSNLVVNQVGLKTFRFYFEFNDNPYFSNRMLVKDILQQERGGVSPYIQPILWKGTPVSSVEGDSLNGKVANTFYEWYLGHRPANILYVTFKLLDLIESAKKWTHFGE